MEKDRKNYGRYRNYNNVDWNEREGKRKIEEKRDYKGNSRLYVEW